MARVGEKDRASRCLWARQRGDGLPSRGDLRYREECALPDAEEHLGQTLKNTMEGPRCAALLRFKPMALRFALIAACLALASPGYARDRIQVVTTTTDLRSLTEAVGGEHVAAVSVGGPHMDEAGMRPRAIAAD